MWRQAGEGADGWPDGRQSALPVDIAFLARHGVAPSQLAAVAHRAERLGVEASREIIASGLIDEAEFYRALAEELGLPFHAGPLAFRSGSFEAVRREAFAMADDPHREGLRFAIAPEGRFLRRLLEAGASSRGDVAVMTPSAFATSLRAANAAALAREMSGLDEAGCARASARTGASRGQKVFAGLVLVAVAAGGVLAPLATFFALALMLVPLFLGLIYLRLAAAMEQPQADPGAPQRWRLNDARLPVYTVAVPLYREERVLRQIVDALAALDYPPAKLDIMLLVEQDDAPMMQALSRLTLPPHTRSVIVPSGPPRTKPRALNLGLIEARGTLFTIYDAEDIPDPQQLRLAAARFLRAKPDLACLQARLIIDHAAEGCLPGLFALEYAGLFGVINPGLLRFGLPIMLGGTSNHFRTEALRQIGGWDAWNVTEDADLSLRLVRSGFRIDDLPSNTREEAPLTVPAWLKQRSRWIKGYMQTLVTHLRSPLALLREAGLPATLAFLSLAGGTVATALGYPLFAVAALFAYSQGTFLMPGGFAGDIATIIAVTVWITGPLALFLPPALGALRQGSARLLWLLPLLPLYYGLVCVAAWMAFHEYFANRFAWNKTQHGLARQRSATDAATTPLPPAPVSVRY